jgi:hypothetical protein
MKAIFILAFLLLFQFDVTAQPIPPRSIEDSVIGWMKVYHFKGAKELMKFESRSYSIAQLSIADSLVNWMQASYVPKGGLGDAKKSVLGNSGTYDQGERSLPPSYGAYTKTYKELKYNSKRKMEPFTDSHDRWSIMANGVVGIAADVYCTPTEYYFTLPTFEEQGYGNDLPLQYGLASHPNTKKYFTYFRRNSSIGNEKTVVLCKNNELPFVKITKGEYLQITEAAVTRKYDMEKKKIYAENKNDQKSIDYFMTYLNGYHEKRVICLKNNREKYRSRLQEPAKIFTEQPDVLLENYPDVFEGTGGSAISLFVYKIDPAVAELCKTDKPQWIRVTWHGDLTDRVGKHQHESIINNFNFDYVYNFFFDPDKVKGQQYKPLHPPVLKEVVAVKESSAASKKNAADKNIHFFEDFSTSAMNKTPAGWRVDINYDGAGVVTKLEEAEGNWLVVAGDRIATNSIRKPYPQDFTLSYDLISSENFKWGGRGLTLQLAKETSPGQAESYLKLKLRPGYGGGDGELTLDPHFPFPSGYPNRTTWYVAKGFSNNKKINRVAVMIRKTGENLQVFIDNTKIAELEKVLPATHLFNTLYFDGGTREGDKFYISNIKMTKE